VVISGRVFNPLTDHVSLIVRAIHSAFLIVRKPRTDIGKYCLVNRTIKSWNQLSARLKQGADKSLARAEKEQATATEDFEFHISYL
jgi:hypothetical protein